MKKDILKAIMCEDYIVDPRIFASYCLYFDKVYIPVFKEKCYPLFLSADRSEYEYIHHPIYIKWHKLQDICVFPSERSFLESDLASLQRHLLWIRHGLISMEGDEIYKFRSQLSAYLLGYYHKHTDKQDEDSKEIFISQHEELRNMCFKSFFKNISKDIKRDAHWMASALALKSIELVMPSRRNIKPEEIIELREKLKDTLLPFRMTMLRLVKELRSYLNEPDIQLSDVYKEAEFLVDSTVLPNLFEVKRKIEKHDDQLIRKIFGSILKVLGLSGKFAALPSPSSAIDWAKGMGEEVISVGETVFDMHQEHIQSGLIYLTKIEDYFSKGRIKDK